MHYIHHSVLLKETIALLSPHDNEVYLDLTAGYGGHAQAMMSAAHLSNLYLRDRDEEAIAFLQNKFSSFDNVKIEKGDFVDLSLPANSIDLILLDLGVSSPQLDQASRGFSYKRESFLDMRQDRTQAIQAYDIVNFLDQKALIRILHKGSDLNNKIITSVVNKIIGSRNKNSINTTTELATIIGQVMSSRPDNLTKQVFQALRIEVNQELNQLEQVLPRLLDILKKNGRLAIMSFHSKEDKIVKAFFQTITTSRFNIIGQLIEEAPAISLTKKAIKADKNDPNSRARSVRLRAIKKK